MLLLLLLLLTRRLQRPHRLQRLQRPQQRQLLPYPQLHLHPFPRQLQLLYQRLLLMNRSFLPLLSQNARKKSRKLRIGRACARSVR